MRNVYDVLLERGFIEQTTHENEIRELLGKEKVTLYIGYGYESYATSWSPSNCTFWWWYSYGW